MIRRMLALLVDAICRQTSVSLRPFSLDPRFACDYRCRRPRTSDFPAPERGRCEARLDGGFSAALFFVSSVTDAQYSGHPSTLEFVPVLLRVPHGTQFLDPRCRRGSFFYALFSMAKVGAKGIMSDFDEFKSYYAFADQLIESMPKEQLADCLRLLAVYVAGYRSQFGEMPRQTLLELLGGTEINDSQTRLLRDGMGLLVG